MTTEAPPAVCAGCGAAWREGARFCGRCGRAPDGTRAPAEDVTAIGPRGLTIALVTYFAVLGVLAGWWLTGDTSTATSFFASAGFLVIGVVGAAYVGRETWSLYRLPSLSVRGTLLALASLVVIWAMIWGLMQLFSSSYIDPIAEFHGEDRGLAYTLVVMAVLPAVTEELLFRGVILTGLRGVFRPTTAVVVSGLMFSTMHISIISFVDHALLGIVFGAVCLRSRSLWPSMFLHAGWNAGVTLLAW